MLDWPSIIAHAECIKNWEKCQNDSQTTYVQYLRCIGPELVFQWFPFKPFEALALIRGLEGECMSPKMSLKLRQDPHLKDPIRIRMVDGHVQRCASEIIDSNRYSMDIIGYHRISRKGEKRCRG